MVMNRITVVLDGRDNLSRMIRGIGLLTDSVFAVGSRAVNGFTDSLKAAAASQSDIVKSVGSLASTANLGFEESSKLTQNITENLAQYAAALPGTTDNYVQLFRAISDDIAGINMDMNEGSLNIGQYSDQVSALSAKFQALGADLPFSQVLNPLQKILAGGSMAQLRKLKFFQSNPVLLQRITELLEATGKAELDELSKGDRLDLTLKALDLTLTDDTIARLNDTVDAQTQSFLTRIFDPTVGVFGLLRDLDRQTAGVQSAMTEITKLWTAIVGSDGVIFAFFELLESVGIDFGDPMQRLANLSANLTAGIKRITQSFEVATNYFNAGSNELGSKVIRDLINRFTSILPDGIGNFAEALSSAINFVSTNLLKVDWIGIGSGLGKAIARLLGEIPQLIQLIDFGALYNLGFWITGALITVLYEAVSSIDGRSLAVGIGALLLAVMTPALAAIAVKTVAAIGIGIGGVPAIAIAAIVGIVISLIKTIQANWKAVSATFSAVIQVFSDAFTGVFKLAGGLLTGNIPMIKSGIQDLMDSFKGLFDLIKGTIDAFRANFGMSTSGMLSAQQSQAVADQRFLDTARRAGTTRALGTPGNPVGSRADGQIGSNLLAAAIRESRAMPSGSGLVVANTSETILNRRQTGALESAIGGLQIGSITINSSAHLSDQLANEIFGAIEQRWEQYKNKKATALG